MATKISKILVTGGSGFIGSHLMKALGDRGANYDVATTDQGVLDILDYDLLEGVIKSLKPSAIIHLAAISSLEKTIKSPTEALQTNIIGSYNVMNVASKYGVRVVLASSAAAFEPSTSLYAASKRCMEIISGLFDNIIIVRMFNVYGAGSKSVVNKFVKRVKSTKDVLLNGNTIRDYVYVGDIVNALISIADAEDPEKYIEIGTGRGVTLKKLVSIIMNATDRISKIVENPAIREVQESIAKNPSYYYKTTLEQGVKKII